MLTKTSAGSAPVPDLARSQTPVSERDKTFEFHAFLSYSHAADGALAPAVQSGLQQFAKPWNRLRAIRLFRDKTGMSANPGLWSTITAALNSSRYFLLMASPGAAGSHWVNKEVEHWLKEEPAVNILILLTDGEIAWDTISNDFDWSRTNALPPALRGTFSEEPLWVDLRFAKKEEHLSLNNPAFREIIADLSSVLRGIPKDQLIGEDVRQHRKAVVFRRSVITGLAALTIIAGVAAVLAVKERNLAQKNEAQAKQNEQLAKSNEELAKNNEQRAIKNEQLAKSNEELAKNNEQRAIKGEADARKEAQIALARQFAAQANDQFQQGNLVTSHALAIESLRASDTFQGRRALSEVLQVIPPKPEIIPGSPGKAVDTVTFSPDNRWMAWGDHAGRIVISDRSRQKWNIVSETQRPPILSLAFSPDGRWLAAGVNGGVWLLDIEAGRALQQTPIATSGNVWSAVFSPDSQYLVIAEGGVIGVLQNTSGHWSKMEMAAAKNSFLKGKAAVFINNTILAVARSNGLSFMTFPALEELSFLSLGEAQGIEAPLEDAGCASVALSERPDILPNLRLLLVGCSRGTAIVRLPEKDFATASYAFVPIVSSDPAHLTFSSDHKYVAAKAQVRDAIQVYEMERMRQVFRTNRPSPSDLPTPSFVFQPDGHVLAAGLQDGSLAIWHLSKGVAALRWLHPSKVSALSFSPDKKWLATTAYGEGTLTIFSTSDIPNAKLLHTFQMGKDLTKPIFSPDGRLLLVADKETIHLLQTNPWKRLTPREIAGDYFQVAFSPDSHMLVAVNASGIRRFDTGSWQERRVIKGKFSSGFRFSPDGKWLATTADTTPIGAHARSILVQVWNLATGEEVAWKETGGSLGQLRKRPAQGGFQNLIADAEDWPRAPEQHDRGELISPDRQWKLGQRTSSSVEFSQVGSGVVGLLDHDGLVLDAGFSLDGRWLLTSSDEGAVRVWPLMVPDLINQACKLLPRNLTKEEWKSFGVQGEYRKTCPSLP